MAHSIVVTVICDGMRPDFVDDGLTPTLARLKREGTWFAAHRGIFPSVTRASSASIGTGSHPISHGLRGNSIGLPGPDGLVFHDVGKPEYHAAHRAHFGRWLDRPSLAARAAALGEAIHVSNASPGTAYFHDAEGHGHLFHRCLCHAPGRRDTGERLAAPAGWEGDRIAAARFISELLERRPPAATLWLSEPDKTMHAVPLGDPRHLAAMVLVDGLVGEVARAVDLLREAGHDVLLMVGSDHGHEAVTEVIPVERRLYDAGFKRTLDGGDILVAPQGSAAFVQFAPAAMDRIDEVVDWLGAQRWVAAVHHGEGLRRLGQAPAADMVMIEMAKSEGTNANGVPGLTAMAVRFSEAEEDVRRDCGMHGGRGPWESRPTLIAHGSGFEAGAISTAATSIVDLAPTAAAHLGLRLDGFDGRPLQHGPMAIECGEAARSA